MTDQKTNLVLGASILSGGLEPFTERGIITHVNGQILLKPITFERGDMAIFKGVKFSNDAEGFKVVIPNNEYVVF